MSRIGKLPIEIPSGVTITVNDHNVAVTGPKGTLEQFLLPHVTVKVQDNQVVITRDSDEKIAKANHGLMRALINNMVLGVSQGFEKKLEVNGVGFRVSGGGQALSMNLGFSHPVDYK